MNPLVSLQAITARVGSRLFFEHTSWDLRAGEHWAIYGPNGSGKSVLAGILTRSVTLTDGQVLYDFNGAGSRPFPRPHEILVLSAETHQAFLQAFTDYHQARWQSMEGEEAPTVRELLGWESIRRRFFTDGPLPVEEPAHLARRREEFVELLGITSILERKVLHISNGESRKVLVARLLLQSPRLLILDDPYTGLDAAARLALSDAIARLLEDAAGPQVLFISARAEEIPAGIEHVLSVQDGKVAACGKRADVLAASSLSPNSSPGAAQRSARLPVQAAAVQNKALLASLSAYERAVREKLSGAPPVLIEMDGVNIAYGGVQILKDIHWTVRAGERWALLGHNGAGKSTLLSLVLGDNSQVYANAVCIFGRARGSGESIWEVKRHFGWVSPELHIQYRRDTTCAAVVCSGFYDSVGLYHHCQPEQQRAAHAWLEAFGLAEQAGRPFQSLSAGQQRQVLLARALVKAPPVLILDEPCQGLDGEHRRAFIALLDELCAHTPLTLVYVSHLQEELPASVTHRLVLRRGEQVAQV